MKLNKKKVFTVALAVCLIAILSLSSLAWFTYSDEVTNNFLVATDEEGQPDFSVDVTEDGGDDGKENDEGGLTYENILPGDELDKEVTVTNTGAYNEFIRVVIEITDATVLRNALGTDYKLENCFVGFDPEMWKYIGVNYAAEEDLIIVVAYYDGILEAGESITLFTNVIIPPELTVEDAAALECGFDITVKAHAVQSDNLGTEDPHYAFNNVVGWKALADYSIGQ